MLKKILLASAIFAISSVSTVHAQLSGTKSIPGDYASIQAAVAALNAGGVGPGGVTFNIAAGYTETTANVIINIVSNQPNASNPIVFQKSGAGANPLVQSLVSGSGTIGNSGQGLFDDAFFRIVGTDYITFDGIDVLENYTGATQTLRIEYGFELLRASQTDGCQNVTIKNCTITLQKTNFYSQGIGQINYNNAGAVTSPTALSGRHENNKFYSNAISNVYCGINLVGYGAPSPYTYYDQNTEIGVQGGNTITNFGGGVNAVFGITVQFVNGLKIANNTINGGSGSTSIVYGMFLSTGTNSNADVYGNTLTLTSNATTTGVYGIYNNMGNNGTNNTVNIYNNTITGCSVPNATSGVFYGIYQQVAPYNLNIYGNQVTNNSYGSSTSTGTMAGIYSTTGTLASGTYSIYNNTVSNNTSTATSGTRYGIYSNSTVPVVNITGNTVSNHSSTAGAFFYIYQAANPSTLNMSYNTVSGNTMNSATGYHMYLLYQAGTPRYITINNNSVTGNTQASGASNLLYGIYNASDSVSGTVTMSNNNVSGNSMTSPTNTSLLYAIYNASSSPSSVDMNYNTVSGNTTSGSSDRYYIYNGAAASTLNMNYNTITNNTNSAVGYMNLLRQAGSCVNTTINNNTVSRNSHTASGYYMYLIYNSNAAANGTVAINNNTVNGNSITNAFNSWYLYGIYNATTPLSSVNMSGNSVYSNTSVNATLYGMNITTSANTDSIYSNSIYNLSSSSTGIIYGMYESSTATKYIYQNSIYNLTGTGGSVYGLYQVSGSPSWIYGNNIYGINSTTSSSVSTYGMYLASGTVYAYNNFISDINASASTQNPGVYGIYVSAVSVADLFYNTIFLNAASSSASTFGSAAIWANTGYNVILRNNIFINASTPGPSGGNTVAYWRSNSTLTTYSISSNNNCFYAGNPAPNRLIYYDYTNADQTMPTYKTRMTPKDSASVYENPHFSNSSVAPYNLHIDSNYATTLESGAITYVATQDFDLQNRFPNPGYPCYGSCSTPPTAPDIGADEFGGIHTNDAMSPSIIYTLLSNTNSTLSRTFNPVTVTDDRSGVDTLTGTRPRVYYKKKSNANTWSDNTPLTDGWKFSEATGTGGTPYTFLIDYTHLFPSGTVSFGDTIQYFVTAQDKASPVNVGINSGTFNSQPPSVNLTAANFPLTGTINYYIISNSFSGGYYVGTSQPYPTLTGIGGFFEAINAGSLSGNVTAYITSNITENGTNALNQWSETGPGGYTITIVPVDGVEKVLSGSVALGGMIRLNGTDRTIFDGRYNGSGKFLRFRNTNTTNPTFSFANDATNNVLEYITIEGGNTSSALNTSNGVVFFGLSAGSTGNDNNTIDHCDIKEASGTPLYGIFSSGDPVPGVSNSGNVISNNNIYNFYSNSTSISSGIFISTGTSDWTITGNSFYQTAARIYSLSGGTNIVFVSTEGGNFNISYNYIGGSGPNAAGMWAQTASGTAAPFFYGIRFNPGSAAASTVQGNIITNINFTTNPGANGTIWFIGIFGQQGGPIIVRDNVIGAGAGNGAITVNISSSAGSFTSFVRGIDFRESDGLIQNNTVGSIILTGSTLALLTFDGIIAQSTPADEIDVIGNTVGSTVTANSIQTTISSIPTLITGINVFFDALPTQISGNTVANISDISTQPTTQMMGIRHRGTGTPTITNNTIFNLSTASTLSPSPTANPSGFNMNGILAASSGTSQVISGNTVYGLKCTTTGAVNAVVTGIAFTNGNSTGLINKNRVYNLTNTAAGTAPIINGIHAYFGANWTLTNNQITLTNGEPTDNTEKKLVGQTFLSVNPGFPTETQPVISGQRKNGPVIVEESSPQPETKKQILIPEMTDANDDASTNGVIIRGIFDDVGEPNVLTTYYNSVYIGGTASSGSNNSYAYFRDLNDVVNLSDNLFFNARTGGTGFHYAIGNVAGSAGWASSSSNYNVFVSSNANTIGEWGAGVQRTIELWRTSSGTDKQTWSTTSSVISGGNLFSSITNGDLHIQYSNTAAWLVSGKGIAVTGQNSDIDGNPRPTTVSQGVTDIGSDEFTSPSLYSVLPPLATQSVPPAPGVTSVYNLYGRNLCSIYWDAASTLFPTTMNIRYYSGELPPNITSGNSSESYWNISVGGGTFAGKYNVTINFGDNETYTISSPAANTILAKYDASWTAYPKYISGTTAEKSQLDWPNLTVKVDSLQNFSNFALTDANDPLPVNISYYGASLKGRDVTLKWITEKEINNRGFEIQRCELIPGSSESYTDWNAAGFRDGEGNSNSPKTYLFEDKKLNAGTYKYRLKQIDYNGNSAFYELRDPDKIVVGIPDGFVVSQNYPNPSNPKSKIDYGLPFDAKVTIKVYDITGREVQILADEFRQAGYYTAEFDGTNLASGVYFYRAVTESAGEKFVRTMKMLLLK